MFKRFGDSPAFHMSDFSNSRTGTAHLAIREHILAGRLRPHHHVSFNQVGETLGMSENLVSFAAFQLAGHGYLPDGTPHRLVPHNWNESWIDGWSEMREMLLVMAVRRITQQSQFNFDFLETLVDFRVPSSRIDSVVAEEFIVRSRFFCDALIALCGIKDSTKIYQSIYTSALHRMSARAATSSELRFMWGTLQCTLIHLKTGNGKKAAKNICSYARLCAKLLQRHVKDIDAMPHRFNVTFESMEAEALSGQRNTIASRRLPWFDKGLVDFATFNDYLTARQRGHIP
jgi:DNA-binding GntR family transcriptional regulator